MLSDRDRDFPPRSTADLPVELLDEIGLIHDTDPRVQPDRIRQDAAWDEVERRYGGGALSDVLAESTIDVGVVEGRGHARPVDARTRAPRDVTARLRARSRACRADSRARVERAAALCEASRLAIQRTNAVLAELRSDPPA